MGVAICQRHRVWLFMVGFSGKILRKNLIESISLPKSAYLVVWKVAVLTQTKMKSSLEALLEEFLKVTKYSSVAPIRNLSD